MQVKINGKAEEVQEGTILDLLKIKNIDPRMVAVEVNSHMVEQHLLETTVLKADDELEFLFYMGGGRCMP